MNKKKHNYTVCQGEKNGAGSGQSEGQAGLF